MKIVLLFTLLLTPLVVFGESSKDSPDKQDSYEQLKKEFEELRDKPPSKSHIQWVSECQKNADCRKNMSQALKKLPSDQLVKEYLELIDILNEVYTGVETIGELKNKLTENIDEVNDYIKKINEDRQIRKKNDYAMGTTLLCSSILILLNAPDQELLPFIQKASAGIFSGLIGVMLLFIGYKS